MPTIGTFAAGSARGFGTKAYAVVPGTITFTANGTFTIPNYNTIQVSARGGQGGTGGKSTWLGGPGTCYRGTNGADGGNSSAIGGGVSLTSLGGNGGTRGSCPTGASGSTCDSGSGGGNSTATSITYLIAAGGLTIGSSVTVTVGQGGLGGANSGVSPCPGGRAASGADTGYITFTWS